VSFVIAPYRFATVAAPIAYTTVMSHTALSRTVKNANHYTVSLPAPASGRMMVLMWTGLEGNGAPTSATIGGVTAYLKVYNFLTSGSKVWRLIVVIADDVPRDGSGNASLIVNYSSTFAGTYTREAVVIGVTGGVGSNALVTTASASTKTLTISSVSTGENEIIVCIASNKFYGDSCSWSGATEIADQDGDLRDCAAIVGKSHSGNVTFTTSNSDGPYGAWAMLIKLS